MAEGSGSCVVTVPPCPPSSDQDKQSRLPCLSITYDEWKQQKQDSLPVYDPPRTLLPVKKVKRKNRNGMQWKGNLEEESDGRVRKKRRTKAKRDVKINKRLVHLQ